MRVTSHLTRPPSKAVSATALLGADHPLARTLERLTLLYKQSATVAALLMSGLAARAAGVPGVDSLLVAAAVVQAALACGLALVAKQQRDNARELIIEGRGDLPLRSVERERRRLLTPTCRHRLARSLDRIRETAEHPRWLLRGSRPLFRLDTIASVGPELAQIAMLLRTGQCHAAGIAMTERLLCDGESPLYGDDAMLLREAVNLLRCRLET